MDIHLNSDNAMTHQLQYTPAGSSKMRVYDLSTATEIRLEFFFNRRLMKTLSSLTHTGIQIVDAPNGKVSYQPEIDDFEDIFDYAKINLIKWRVINPNNPSGLVFGEPALPVRIIK